MNKIEKLNAEIDSEREGLRKDTQVLIGRINFSELNYEQLVAIQEKEIKKMKKLIKYNINDLE